MADLKISELAALAGNNLATADLVAVVDSSASETKKLYMMHLTVFPHTNDGSPVFGFDLIAGPKKVTGAFHDFSPIDKNHEMLLEFEDQATEYSWSKERELPEWARSTRGSLASRFLAAPAATGATPLGSHQGRAAADVVPL